MPTQVLRIEPRKTLDLPLHAHNMGLVRPITARPVPNPVHVFEDNFRGAEKELQKLLNARLGRRGVKPHHCVDLMLAGPPGYGTPEEWSSQSVEAWAEAAVDWCREMIGPESIVVGAALHRDESAPHVHFTFIPVTNGQLGWCALRDTAAVHAADRMGAPRSGAGARNARSQKAKYSFLQDDCHRAIGQPFRLSRGQVGSTAKHTAVSRQRAAERGAQIAKSDEAKAKQRMAELEGREKAALQEAEFQRKAVVRAASAEADAHRARAQAEADSIVATGRKAGQAERRKGVEDARKIAAGDEELGKAEGVALTPTARRGRRAREQYEARAAKLTEQRDQWKDYAAAIEEKLKGEIEAVNRELTAAHARNADLKIKLNDMGRDLTFARDQRDEAQGKLANSSAMLKQLSSRLARFESTDAAIRAAGPGMGSGTDLNR